MKAASPSPSVAEMLEAYKRIVELQDRLRSLRRRLEQAEGYLRRPGSNRELGLSEYVRLARRWDETTAALRQVDRESQRLLAAA